MSDGDRHNATQLTKLFFLYAGQAETSVQNSSVESGARSDVGIEQPNTTTVNSVNRVGESGASVPGCTPESEGQKVYFVHNTGIVLLRIFFNYCLNLVLIY